MIEQIFKSYMQIVLAIFKLSLQIGKRVAQVMYKILTRLIWHLNNYFERNPYARGTMLRFVGIIALLGVGIAILAAIVSAVAPLLNEVSIWLAADPDNPLILTGMGVAVLVGAAVVALMIRPAWRMRLLGGVGNLKNRLIRSTRRQTLPSGNDNLADIIIIDLETDSNTDDNLLDEIVIHE